MLDYLSTHLSKFLQNGSIKKRWINVAKIVLALIVLFLWLNMVKRAMSERGHSSQYDDFIGYSQMLIFDDVNIFIPNSIGKLNTIAKYPPFFFTIFAPFAKLPVWLGASLWFWLNFFLVIVLSKSFSRTIWLTSEEKDDPPNYLWIGGLLLSSVVIITNLETSQVNIFVLALTVLGLEQFVRHRKTRAGILLGVATAIKITPALFIAYFAYKRQWKTMLWGGVSTIICWGIILPLILGFSRYPEIMESWISYFFGFVEEGTVAEGIGGFRHTNQSLSAAFYRYFTDTPANGGFKDLYVNVMSLSYPAASIVMKGLKIAVLLILLFLCRSAMVQNNNNKLPFEFSLLAIATLYISPISWINHYLLMLLPFTTCLYYILKRPTHDLDRIKLLKSLLLSVFLIWMIHPFVMAFSIPFFGSLILATAMSKILHKKNKRLILSRENNEDPVYSSSTKNGWTREVDKYKYVD